MQKIKQELNENNVGANCVRPQFEGITKNNQKGITLIALIITIIVMLILVGVTINVALNGGLFTKAEQAKTGTQLAVDREELQIAVVSALNNDREIPNGAAIKNNLQEGWNVTPSAEGTSYTCTSPKGNVFTVDNKGNIKPGSEENTNPPQQDLPEIGQVNNQNGESLQVGDYITYNNETWVVMYNDDNYGLQIISQNSKPGIELKGKDGFNNAISLLNAECKKYITTGAEYARCAGSSPTFYKDEVETLIDEFGMDITTALNNDSDYTTEIADYQPFYNLLSTAKISATEDFLMAVRNAEKNIRNGSTGEYEINYGVAYFNFNETEFSTIRLCSGNNITKILTDTDNSTRDLKIFPVIIMNKNIEITGGDGVDTPYTYTFNQQ